MAYDDPAPDFNGDQSAVEAYLNHQWNRQAWGRSYVSTEEKVRKSQRRKAKAAAKQKAKGVHRPPGKGQSAAVRNARNRRRRVYERDGYRCVACGLHQDELPEGVALTLDHKVPRSAGGKNTMGNLQTMCRPCNNEKGDSMPDDVAA